MRDSRALLFHTLRKKRRKAPGEGSLKEQGDDGRVFLPRIKKGKAAFRGCGEIHEKKGGKRGENGEKGETFMAFPISVRTVGPRGERRERKRRGDGMRREKNEVGGEEEEEREAP